MADLTTEVLIAGVGPTGALSLALADMGVDHVVVEKHASTTRHPKATYVNNRAMELFRQCGIDREVAECGIPAERLQAVVWCTQLAGLPIAEMRVSQRDIAGGEGTSAITPCMCPQDVLEPIMRRAAEARPQAVREHAEHLRAG